MESPKLLRRFSFRRTESVSVVIIVILTCILPIFSPAFASDNTRQTKDLLQVELQLNVDESQIQSLDTNEKNELLSFLKLINSGDSLFVGKTKAEQSLQNITNSVQSQIPMNIGDVLNSSAWSSVESYLNYLAENTEKALGSSSGVIAPFMGSMIDLLNGIKVADKASELISAINDKNIEDSVYRYILIRQTGLNDSETWLSFDNQYNAIKSLGVDCGKNPNIPQCGWLYAWYKGGDGLKNYARSTYNAYDLSQKIKNNPEYKKSLQRIILAEINQSSVSKKIDFWDGLWGGITGFIKSVGDVGKNAFESVVKTINNVIPKAKAVIHPSSSQPATSKSQAASPTTTPPQQPATSSSQSQIGSSQQTLAAGVLVNLPNNTAQTTSAHVPVSVAAPPAVGTLQQPNANQNQPPINVPQTSYESAPTPAPVVNLTSDYGGVNYSQGTTLRWSSSNADSCTASGGWNGNKALFGSEETDALYSTAIFTLTCTGSGGTTNQHVSISVSPPPQPVAPNPTAPTLTFYIKSGWVPMGSSTTLIWSSSNADSCTASGGWNGVKATSGSEETSPINSAEMFSLTCTGAGGSVNRETDVGIQNAPELSPADSFSATQGQTFSLTGDKFTLNGKATLHFEKPDGGFYPDEHVQANAAGKISFTWQVAPDAAPGRYSVSATDDTSGIQGTSMGFSVVQAAGLGELTLSVSPSSGSIGTVFAITGKNYSPMSADIIRIEKTYSGGTLSYPTQQPAADASGNLNFNWTSPDFNPPNSTMPGTVSIWALDNKTGRKSPTVTIDITQ